MLWYLAVPGNFIVEGVPNARPTLTARNNILTTGATVSGVGNWEVFTFEPSSTTPDPTVRENAATLIGYEDDILREVWTMVGAIYVHPDTPEKYTVVIGTAHYSRTRINFLTGVGEIIANPTRMARSSQSLSVASEMSSQAFCTLRSSGELTVASSAVVVGTRTARTSATLSASAAVVANGTIPV